jgi:hypothetical protein
MVVKLAHEWGMIERKFQLRMQNANRANCNFLKCLHSGRPLDVPHWIKCLPDKPHSLKCFFNKRVTIRFPLIF